MEWAIMRWSKQQSDLVAYTAIVPTKRPIHHVNLHHPLLSSRRMNMGSEGEGTNVTKASSSYHVTVPPLAANMWTDSHYPTSHTHHEMALEIAITMVSARSLIGKKLPAGDDRSHLDMSTDFSLEDPIANGSVSLDRSLSNCLSISSPSSCF